jgi:hypothetical protein
MSESYASGSDSGSGLCFRGVLLLVVWMGSRKGDCVAPRAESGRELLVDLDLEPERGFSRSVSLSLFSPRRGVLCDIPLLVLTS